jgi:photosynthetic reaction center H subunit
MAERVSLETHAVEAISRLPECELAEGAPDVRGWEVTSPTSLHVGVLKDLLIDLGTMRVRYLDVVLDADPARSRRILLPIGKVWINDALDQVVIVTSHDLDEFPEYDPATFNREFERDLLSRFGDTVDDESDFYASSAFDDSRFRRGQHAAATCGRREEDAENGSCSLENTDEDVPEAANGVELPVVTDEAAD